MTRDDLILHLAVLEEGQRYAGRLLDPDDPVERDLSLEVLFAAMTPAERRAMLVELDSDVRARWDALPEAERQKQGERLVRADVLRNPGAYRKGLPWDRPFDG